MEYTMYTGGFFRSNVDAVPLSASVRVFDRIRQLLSRVFCVIGGRVAQVIALLTGVTRAKGVTSVTYMTDRVIPGNTTGLDLNQMGGSPAALPGVLCNRTEKYREL